MKRFLCLIVLVASAYTSSFAQGDLRLGVNAGIPMGDVDDAASFRIGADVAYMISLMDIVQVGPMVGYSHFFGKMNLMISNIYLLQHPEGLVCQVPLLEAWI